MRISTLAAVATLSAFSLQGVPSFGQDQRTVGACSNAIAGVNGNVTVHCTIAERLEAGLRMADAKVLQRLREEGLQVRILERHFQNFETASLFFSNSISDNDTLVWFKAYLAEGFKSDLMVQRSNGSNEGILITAWRSGNFGAISALLQAGANPHAYQDLQFEPQSIPFFIFPLNQVFRDERFNREEKQQLISLMIKNGVLVPKLAPEIGRYFISTFQRHSIDRLRGWLQAYPNVSLSLVPDACTNPMIGACRPNSSHASTAVCDFNTQMPVALAPTWTDGSQTGFVRMRFVGLLGIYGGSPHYLALEPSNNSEVMVVRLSADGDTWTVYNYMKPGAGLGHCNPDKPSSDDLCWRSARLTRNHSTGNLEYFGHPLNPSFCPKE